MWGVGILGGGLLLSSFGSGIADQFTNREGDGIIPRNSITSRVLGIEVGGQCYRNDPDDTCSDSGVGYAPWCCEYEDQVVDRSESGGAYLRRPKSFRENVATTFGSGSEMFLGLGAVAVAGYGYYKKKR